MSRTSQLGLQSAKRRRLDLFRYVRPLYSRASCATLTGCSNGVCKGPSTERSKLCVIPRVCHLNCKTGLSQAGRHWQQILPKCTTGTQQLHIRGSHEGDAPTSCTQWQRVMQTKVNQTTPVDAKQHSSNDSGSRGTFDQAGRVICAARGFRLCKRLRSFLSGSKFSHRFPHGFFASWHHARPNSAARW